MRRVFQIGTFPSTGAGKAAKVRILCIHPLRRLRYSHPPWGLQKLQMRWVTEVTFPFFSYQKIRFWAKKQWSCLLNAHLYISIHIHPSFDVISFFPPLVSINELVESWTFWALHPMLVASCDGRVRGGGRGPKFGGFVFFAFPWFAM